jgi:hypothetical protein
MKAAIYGFRKILLFLIAVSAVLVLTLVSFDALKVISDAKATQLAAMVGAALAALGTIFTTLMSAFKSGYDRDARIDVASKMAPPP